MNNSLNDQIINGSGNVFADLKFPPQEAELLAAKASLFNELRKTIFTTNWTAGEAAKNLSISETQTSALLQGQHEMFTFEMLTVLADRLNALKIHEELLERYGEVFQRLGQ